MDKRCVLRYRKFPIYIKLRKFRKDFLLFLKSLPKTERKELVNQGKRAINSACLNIAEGANKPTDKEFAQFVNRSLTSLEEVASVLDLCFDDKYLVEKKYFEFDSKLKILAEDLLKFERSLRRN